MPISGTIYNPLQVTPGQVYAQQLEGERQTALAQALAQQQLQAGPKTWMNILAPFIQQFGANMQAKQGEEKLAKAFEGQQQLERQAKENERLEGQRLADARRAAWLRINPDDVEGAEIVAMTGKPPPRKQTESPWTPSGGMLVNKITGETKPIPGFEEQAARIAAAGRAPSAPREPTFQEYQSWTPEQRAEWDAYKGRRDPNAPRAPTAKDEAAAEQRQTSTRSLLDSIDHAEAMIKGGGLKTGPILGAIAEKTGFKTRGDQEFEAEIGAIVSELRRLQKVPGSGADSDRELAILINQVPNLRTDEQAALTTFSRLREKAKLYSGQTGVGAGASTSTPQGGGWSIRPLD